MKSSNSQSISSCDELAAKLAVASQSPYPWQLTQWQSIVARKHTGDFPHALLLSGIPGLGKGTFANLTAALLLCTDSKNAPCGKCSACNLLAAKTHPDLFYIQPEELDKPIKIDQIRSLVENLNNTSQQCGYQVVIIEPADSMNLASANSLLKTLEEPSGNVVFLLITSKPHLLPATIRSRCQQILFKIPESAIAKKWLAEQLPNSQNLNLVLALTNNSPLHALALIQSDKLKQRQNFFAAFTKFLQGQIDPVSFAAECLNYEITDILSYLETFIADLVKLKYSANIALINEDILSANPHIFTAISLTQLHAFYKKLLTIQQYLNQKFNLNKQMLLENLWLSW